MIQVNNLAKSFGSQLLFEGLSFTMGRGERIGVVGRNGHGKSTLFRILTGEDEPDGGGIASPRGYRIGHLPQTLIFKRATVLEEACEGLPPDERDQVYRAERILGGLGFSEEGMSQPPSTFSGGFQIRINLAKLLLSEPNLLLLDEPTNYLDIVSVRWLTRELKGWKNEFMLISHDRDFMDSVTTHTLGIHRCQARKVEGGTAKLYELLNVEEEIYEKTRQNEQKKRDEVEAFIRRFRAQASKASLVQSRVKQLERMGTKERLADVRELGFDFTESPFEAKTLLECRDLSFSYPEGVPLFERLSFSVDRASRIGIIGKNGRGKSTLLKLLATELTPVTGEVRSHDRTALGYFGQTNILRLSLHNTVEQEIAAANPTLSRTRIRTICGIMMFEGDRAERKVSVLSGGEKSRVLLGKLLATPTNLLLLDEPTSHLDMESIEALVESIEAFSGGVMIVTHSEMILHALANKLIVFGPNGAEFFEGTYQEFLDTRGWDEEETKPTREVKTERRGSTESGNRNKDKGARNAQKRRTVLENKFQELHKELNRVKERMVSAAEKGEYKALETLTKQEAQIEADQLVLLTEIESLQISS